jgi:hypothetical protein
MLIVTGVFWISEKKNWVFGLPYIKKQEGNWI